MEGTERAQSVYFCLNRIVYQSCSMEGTERAQPVHFCLNRIVYQSCRVIWTWKGLSEPRLFTSCLHRIVYQSCSVYLDMEGTERAQPVHVLS